VIAESTDHGSVAFLEIVLELVKEEPTNPTQGVSKFFVTCFSSAKDDLNQWGKYQKSSAGRYAIGFYPAGLNREPNSTLYRVIYDRQKQEEAAKRIVEATVNFYRKGLTGDRLNDPELWAREFFLGWDDWIYKLSPLTKSFAWESEREFRIVHELKVAEFPRVRFAQKKTMLARYLPLDFPCWVKERSARLPIASVMIGPGGNLASTRVSTVRCWNKWVIRECRWKSAHAPWPNLNELPLIRRSFHRNARPVCPSGAQRDWSREVPLGEARRQSPRTPFRASFR
jgi:hypothetical protein